MTVEVDSDGLIYRGQYWIEGGMVIVSYGAKVKRCTMSAGKDAHAVAQQLLREIVAELHESLDKGGSPKAG